MNHERGSTAFKGAKEARVVVRSVRKVIDLYSVNTMYLKKHAW